MTSSDNQIIKLKGKVKWASVPPNPPRKPPADYIDPLAPNNSFYSVEVECTQDQFNKLIKLGIPRLTALKVDEDDGKSYIRIKSAKTRRINGEDVSFSDPFIIDSNGVHFDKAIGNGSEAIVISELVPLKKGKALRLKGVQVLNHVAYEGRGNPTDKYKEFLEVNSSSPDEPSLVENDISDFL